MPQEVLQVDNGEREAWPSRGFPMGLSPDGSIALLDLFSAGFAKLDVATGGLTPISVPRDSFGDWVRGPLWLVGDDLLLYRARPRRDVPPKLTENNSPLVGAKPMLSLKLAELSSGRSQTIVQDLDPRSSVSFGIASACR